MIKKLLLITFILLNVKVFVAQSGNSVPPTITNFRIESSTPNRIYFDSNESITATTITGFDLKDHEGITITDISINSGQLNGHYFTVSSDFKWYHNNTFNYTGGSNMQGENGIALNKFDLQYIKNNIPVPSVNGTEFYVDASVSSSGNGRSESEAFKTIQEGVNIVKAGDKVWIKAGNYEAETIVLSKSGTVTNSIQIEGYKNTIGDITSMYYSYGNTTGIENGSNPLITDEMPLLDGGNGSSGTGFSISGNNRFIIVKNLQIKNYETGVSLGSNCSNIILENIIGKDMGGTSNSNGRVFNLNKFTLDTHYTRLINCVAINGTEDNITIGGNNNLVENCKAYCDRGNVKGSIGLPTDYYIKLRGKYNIVRNSLVNRLSKGHNGHGFSLKKFNEYTLVEHCEAINILWALQVRHSVSHHNVFRNCEVHANVPYRFNDATSGGINLMSGSHHNVFKNIYAHDLDKVFVFEKNVEDNANSSDIGHDNIFKNIIIDNIKRSVFYFRNFEPRQTTFNKNKFYNFTLNNVSGGLFEIRGTSSNISFNNNEIKNFIFNDVSSLLINSGNRTLGTSEFIWDYNNFYNGFPIQGTNATIVDPKFIDSSLGNFKLQQDSECIDSGIILNNVTTDFDGEARLRGNGYDIGAYEDQSDVPGAGSDVTICNGSSTTLTASGTGGFSWSTGETTQSITVSPSTTTTYSVTVTNENSTITDSVIVTVNESPTADAGSDVTICNGFETVLTALGGDTYLWSTGETTESITVSPNVNTTYSVTTSNDGCTTTAVDEVIVTVNSTPNLSAGDDVEVCIGSSITLTASGSDNYVWNTGETTASISVSPSVETIYTVTSTLGSCSISDDVIVTVDNPPSVSLGADATICSGDSITLTAEGNGNFLWSTGETTQSITISPSITTTYSITATSSCDTSGVTDEIIVNVIPEIILDAGSDITICQGENVTLTASGNNDFLWSTGETTASITVNPTSTTTYSVTSTSGNCSLSDDVIVTVDSPPSVNLGTDITICSGESVTLMAEGNGNFVWSTGETASSITVSPSTTTTYSVTASSSCSSNGVTDEIVVIVNEMPNIDAGSDVTIEEGSSITLTATGEGNFLWNTGETTPIITVSPSTTAIYTVVATLNGSCSSEDSVVVTVTAVNDSSQQVIANAGEDVEICKNSSSVVLTATGGEAYLWNTGEVTASITVNPTETTIYTVTVSNSHSIDSDEVTVFIDESCSGIGNRVTIEREFNLFPNPTEGKLNIELNGFNDELNITLISLNGKILYTESITNYSPDKILKRQIDLSRFGKGVYFVRIINNSDMLTKKVLVI